MSAVGARPAAAVRVARDALRKYTRRRGAAFPALARPARAGRHGRTGGLPDGR
eukprot:gene12491-21001_t